MRTLLDAETDLMYAVREIEELKQKVKELEETKGKRIRLTPAQIDFLDAEMYMSNEACDIAEQSGEWNAEFARRRKLIRGIRERIK